MASPLAYLLGGIAPASRTAPARTVPATQVNRVVLAAFYLMVFSFNFEMPDRGGWEIPAMTAALFIASTVLALRDCYGRVPGAMLWFADVTATLLVIGDAKPAEGMKGFPLAINLAANFIANQREGVLIAAASFVKKGRTVSVVRTEVRGADNRLLADVTTSHVLSK